MAVAPDSALVADGFRHGLAEGDAHILHGVVGVHFEVALGLNGEVDAPVPRHLIEHVLEERQAHLELRLPGAIEVHVHADACFERVAAARCLAIGRAHGSVPFGVRSLFLNRSSPSGFISTRLRSIYPAADAESLT